MKQTFFLFYSIVLIALISCRQNNTSVKLQEINISDPFNMSNIKIPDFRNCPKFSIIKFGAVTGDKEKISLAIEKANKVGGGVVIIPEGEWITGKVHLKSNVNLHLNKGAVLVFSENSNDYLPAVHTTWEGMECYK